jgi:hypothetical protein
MAVIAGSAKPIVLDGNIVTFLAKNAHDTTVAKILQPPPACGVEAPVDHLGTSRTLYDAAEPCLSGLLQE